MCIFKKQAGLFVWAKINERFKDCYDCADFILHNSYVFITPGEFLAARRKIYKSKSLCD